MKLKSLGLAAMLSAGVPLAAQAADLPGVPHVITSGNAVVKAEPDIATLMINVNISAKDASGAKKQVDELVAKYFDFLKKNGIEKKDIDAANLRTQPDYEYDNVSGKSVLKGYRAIRSVEVKVRKLEQLNDLLDGALKAGLNEIVSVQFGVDNPQKYRDEARQKAIENAIEQADALAKGFNSKVGSIYSINYRAPEVIDHMKYRNSDVMMAGGAAAGVGETYQQDSINFSDQVDVVFELKP
ncbi:MULTISPECIES: oxidative stress defense protein [Photorhabdus]|uniref:26 kDa periplasmic immunogenic protein n=1 Tax=Photorhabdus namnaonensis TaxID=1851568 RepID=A0A1B8YLT7_9GAMM|nr:oxidative stress defense protein [Photorhabdus namnaonensis]MBS9432493.1 oxidative stress defense protein [Photorhabdus hainanensis]OCA56124.1 26 kDa periplasmic immunogenic protein precursor [Photorhabdus namnaonensis]